MEDYIVSGIQQVGIGVEDFKEALDYYVRVFNMDVKILEDDSVADIMAQYMGGKPRKKRAGIVINMQGGGGFEIWQHLEHKPQKINFDMRFGDLGILAAKIKSRDVVLSYDEFSVKPGIEVLGEISVSLDGDYTFFVKDKFGNLFQIVRDNYLLRDENRSTGGPVGAIIGVSDIDKTLSIYRDILGYDEIIADKSGVFGDIAALNAGTQAFRRVLLTHSQPRQGTLANLFGNSYIELVQALEHMPRKLYEGRFWGDPGFIHLCFDIKNMEALKEKCASLGFPFTVDSSAKHNDADSFDMGEAAGHFSYIEDPDGNLIEFVETHKIPLNKKLGLNLDLRKRDPRISLSKSILKLL
ncbi:MAG: VOC family protein, partial [Prolixibacteraceae bacterium]|nr:VOC family protein [Prolixibacteraceae bacterium]